MFGMGTYFSGQLLTGLDQTAIHAILDDSGGDLWFATENGIARCHVSSEVTGTCSKCIEFGTADGLRSRDYCDEQPPRGAWRSRDGHLWFARPKGSNRGRPGSFSGEYHSTSSGARAIHR